MSSTSYKHRSSRKGKGLFGSCRGACENRSGSGGGPVKTLESGERHAASEGGQSEPSRPDQGRAAGRV